MTVKKDLILEGLDCAHCASKIECEVAALQGVSAANLNFATKTLMVEADTADGDIGEILLRTGEIIRKHEPDVTVREKVLERPVRKAYLLVGLGCATCAAKIEKEVRQIEGVKSATVDFATGRMTIEAQRKHDLERIGKQAASIARRIESGVKVVDNAEKKPQEAEEKAPVLKYVLLGIGAVLFLVAYVFSLPLWAKLPLFLVSYGLVGGNVLLSAGRNILKGKVFDENFLMGVATIGAFAIGEYPEAVAVMLFYQVGELLQSLAVNRSRKSIGALMDIRPDSANLKTDTGVSVVAPEEVHPGQFILVKPGEKVPLDGKVTEGRSALNAAALTGEAKPVDVGPGDTILSGSINLNGLLTVEVTKEFGESTIAKILDMVQNASSKKAPSENFITKFARYYTPAVVFAAVALALVPPLFVGFDSFFMWLNRALIFLVVSCPCALVISIPLSFFGGIGGASRQGILVKGGNFLDALNQVDTVVFDKTGTLTKGVFQVTSIETANGLTREQLLEYTALAECYSTHPIAASILKAYGKEVDRTTIENIDELSGFGVKAKAAGKEILAGNEKLLQAQNISYVAAAQPGTVIYVAIDNVYSGSIVIADEIKNDARRAIEELRKLGIGKLAMLTGDSKPIADQVGKQLGLDEVHAELLPGQKVEKLELLQKQTRGKLLFVGDGINDAPVLARADVGVAMGGLGSDAAIEAADIVLMTDEPVKLAAAIRVARRTRTIVMQNIIFALGIKGILLILSAFGIATMWEAVFADVGVTLIAVLNSMRVMRGK